MPVIDRQKPPSLRFPKGSESAGLGQPGFHGDTGHNGRDRSLVTLGGGCQRQLAAIGLLAALVLVAGCRSGEHENAAASTTTPAPSTAPTATTASPTTTADPKKVVLSAYRAFWADIIAVGKTADWQSPRLAAHATGAALQNLQAQFKAAKDRGWVARGTVRLSPSVVSHSATKATVRDCVDATRFGRFDPKTRRWIDQPGGRPDAERVVLVRDGKGKWKVSETVVTGECAD